MLQAKALQRQIDCRNHNIDKNGTDHPANHGRCNPLHDFGLSLGLDRHRLGPHAQQDTKKSPYLTWNEPSKPVPVVSFQPDCYPTDRGSLRLLN